MDSGLPVWLRSEGEPVKSKVVFSVHRTSCRGCSPRTPGSVCPGQTSYITPSLLVMLPVSHEGFCTSLVLSPIYSLPHYPDPTYLLYPPV